MSTFCFMTSMSTQLYPGSILASSIAQLQKSWMQGYHALFQMVLRPVDSLSDEETQDMNGAPAGGSTPEAKAKVTPKPKPKKESKKKVLKQPVEKKNTPKKTDTPDAKKPETPKPEQKKATLKKAEVPDKPVKLKRPAAANPPGSSKRPATGSKDKTELKVGKGFYKRDMKYGFKINGRECLYVLWLNWFILCCNDMQSNAAICF